MSALNRCGIYTVADVAKLAGISKRNAEEWQAQGIIRSTVRSAGIRGRERLYCFADLFAVHLAASLRLAGTPIATIVKAVDAFYSTPTDGDRHYLIIVGDKASIVSCTEAPAHADTRRSRPGGEFAQRCRRVAS